MGELRNRETSDTVDRVTDLLAAALRAWRVGGEVRREADAVLVATASGEILRLARAPPGVPFRWTVATGARTRVAASVAGLLRAVRAAVDPDHRPSRLRIAPQPVVPR